MGICSKRAAALDGEEVGVANHHHCPTRVAPAQRITNPLYVIDTLSVFINGHSHTHIRLCSYGR